MLYISLFIYLLIFIFHFPFPFLFLFYLFFYLSYKDKTSIIHYTKMWRGELKKPQGLYEEAPSLQ